MTVQVVPMQRAHLAAAAELQLEAFRGYMNARLGTRYARAMLDWFMKAEGTITLVALDDDGNVIGYVAGAPDGYGAAMSRAIMPAAVRAALTRPGLLFDARVRRRAGERIRSIFTKKSPAAPHSAHLPRPVIALVAIGVAEQARGRGAGALLLHEFEARARALGMRSMRLSVYDHNAAARRAYEHAGWIAGPGTRAGELSFTRLLT
ncbi:MAG TPA: GNAT family N-acetyltransferase [Thermoanaerobaculia bacterium]|jgi:ribosomal protein S18 acetylase RimI-like enzyme